MDIEQLFAAWLADIDSEPYAHETEAAATVGDLLEGANR